jgi:hypothetical protein
VASSPSRAAILVLLAGAGCLSSPRAHTADGGTGSGDAAPAADANPNGGWRLAASTLPFGALWGPKLAFDGDKILLYGGSTTTAPDGAQALLWTWDGGTFTRLCDDASTACEPGPRVRHGFVWDPDRQYAWLFGGQGYADGTNDLWGWDGFWFVASTANGTPPRHTSGWWMADDTVRHTIVMFGGTDDSANDSNLVYAFDGSTGWSAHGGAGGPSPRHDDAATAVFDGARGQVLIYADGSSDRDDLWGWDGSSWEELAAKATGTPRAHAALGYDPVTGRILIVNGFDAASASSLSETVWLDPDGQPLCREAGPPARDTGGMAYDALRDVFVYLGGNGASCSGNAGNCDEIWELDRAAMTAACGGGG